jgi:hypothetical protein
VAISASLSAQWLKYPTPGVPRTADGKPNLSAPAPRMPDGRPDLSGVWQLETTASADADYPAAPEFINLGARLPGAALPYQPWAAAVVKERRTQLGKDDPVGFCKPAGAIRLLTFPPYRKFLQLPALFVISPSGTSPTARSFSTAVRSRTIRLRPSMVTPPANGTVTRSWCRRTACAMGHGSIEAAAPSATRRR